MSETPTISATEFKARCLGILDDLANRKLARVHVTKRGKIVAVLTPPEDAQGADRGLHGWLAGSVVAPPELDLTAPALDEPFLADEGIACL